MTRTALDMEHAMHKEAEKAIRAANDMWLHFKREYDWAVQDMRAVDKLAYTTEQILEWYNDYFYKEYVVHGTYDLKKIAKHFALMKEEMDPLHGETKGTAAHDRLRDAAKALPVIYKTANKQERKEKATIAFNGLKELATTYAAALAAAKRRVTRLGRVKANWGSNIGKAVQALKMDPENEIKFLASLNLRTRLDKSRE